MIISGRLDETEQQEKEGFAKTRGSSRHIR